MHYTATQIALLVCESARTIKDKMKLGFFGPNVFFNGTEYVAAASAVNFYMENNRIAIPQGVAARTEGEYRRKAALPA